MKVTSSEQSKRVAVWAIDPFENQTRPPASWLPALLNGAGGSLELYPVHILSIPNDVGDGTPDALEIERATRAAEKAAEEFLRNFHFPGSVRHPVTILQVGSAARNANARRLLDFAEELGADFLMATSHGRSGVRRWVLGSFAESLLQDARRPVLFMTHAEGAVAPRRESSRVLFATDFSDSSREAFFQFLPEARRLGWEIAVFHSVSFPATALAQGFGAPLVFPEAYFPEQMVWAQDEAARWAELAESRGVRARWIVKDDGVGTNAAESILGTAEEEEVCMIALASVSGTFAALTLGSVAREVFRANRCPVWVYGPRALEPRVILHGLERVQAGGA